MRSTEIREKFLQFFEKNGHTRVASSSLIPADDPTLFFTNAGMVQFKNIFLGMEQRPFVRATTAQKCLRVSGKHNDLENVGLTPRHHTFFEMLGNFSFGDYFKEEAIALAWEFLTKTVGLPKAKLYITVFENDDEAEKLWLKHVAKDRIFRMTAKDNFWSMGETGPCGPCSEILWDFGSGKFSKNDLETDRFFEIWNLVFMEFNRDTSGVMTKLPKPSIDTGMGLERLSALLQGVQSNWETDLFVPLIAKIGAVTGADLKNGDHQIAARVIADHVRCAVFLISDGLFPSNEGRGYILRRILRRAVRYGRKMGMRKPFFNQIAAVVLEQMGKAYPEIVRSRALIEKILTHEEERFLETIDRGLEILEGEFQTLQKSKEKILPGNVVFKLYDTYGFPKDLTDLIARERQIAIDETGFEAEMEKQRDRARKAWKGSGAVKADPIFHDLYQKGFRTKFVGYERGSERGKILQVLEKGEASQLIVDATPCYAEGGGQVGDIGTALADGVEVQILDTQKPFSDLFVHQIKIVEGTLRLGMILNLNIDQDRRRNICSNHTATHLMHAALRQILGEHVKQAGSFLDDHHLRFDFSHFSKISDEQLADIESLVNKVIGKNLAVKTAVLPHQEAIARGALAFFGEKYGEVVRMVQIEDFSKELCGGTHTATTGEIVLFKILKERSVASGVRRIEAVTGEAAKISKEEKKEVALPKQGVENNQDRSERIRKAIHNLDDLSGAVKKISGVNILSAVVHVADPSELREVADAARQKLGSGIVILGADIGGKAAMVVAVTADLTKKHPAGGIMKKLAAELGGSGGGRPDLAQGGGPDSSKLSEVLSKFQTSFK